MSVCCVASSTSGALRWPQVIKRQLAEGVTKRRVGFISTGPPARQHSEVTTPDGKVRVHDTDCRVLTTCSCAAPCGPAQPEYSAGLTRASAGTLERCISVSTDLLTCRPKHTHTHGNQHSPQSPTLPTCQPTFPQPYKSNNVSNLIHVSASIPTCHHLTAAPQPLQVIGEVTSGAFSPCLKKNIAMGYVAKGQDKAGTKLKLVVRGKAYDAEVTKMPFVPTHYYKG